MRKAEKSKKHFICSGFYGAGMICRSLCPVIIIFAFILNSSIVYGARIKDITVIKGIRTNQLIGYGLVVGLDGTGDKSKIDFTTKALANMMERMGIQVDQTQLKVKNVAAVMVTANLPPFARIGNKIDVLVSSLGDAKSLSGGTLLLTDLKGVDGRVYALAQGPVAIGGIGAGGAGGSTLKNHLEVARIANGASVEREIPVHLDGRKTLILSLLNPDFTTAKRIEDTINTSIGSGIARTIDSSSLVLNIPKKMRKDDVADFIADIETLTIVPDSKARVVVNEKTGTVVIGGNVTISTVAVAHGNLTVTIRKTRKVSQPLPLSQGKTIATTGTNVNIKEQKARVMLLPGSSTIEELVRGLNSMGVSPRDLISILQAIKAAGALQAELVII